LKHPNNIAHLTGVLFFTNSPNGGLPRSLRCCLSENRTTAKTPMQSTVRPPLRMLSPNLASRINPPAPDSAAEVRRCGADPV